MADSILRLKVESQEYDQKIKRAAEGIQQYAQKCRDAGGTLQYLDDGVLEFVQALGNMDTVATGTKQQLREMSNALTTLTQTYRGLTDEEKASPFGQELAKGIQQLTERAGQAQDAMADVQASIRNAASDTRIFDQMAQGMSVATAGFQGLTGAGKLLGIEIGNDVEVIAKLQAAMAVTNSLTTIQTALQKQSALMQGVQAVQAAAAAAAQTTFAEATGLATVAQRAFNVVANANPYMLLATAAAAVIGTLFAFADSSDDATDSLKKQEKAADDTSDALDRLNWKYDALIKQQEALGKSGDNLRIAQLETRQTEVSGKFNDALSAGDTEAAAKYRKELENIGRQILDIKNKKEQSAAVTKWFVEEKDFINTEKEIKAAISHFQALREEVGQGSKKWKEYNQLIEDYKAKLPKDYGNRRTVTTTHRTSAKIEDTNFAADSIMAQEKEIQRLTDAWKRAGGELRAEYLTQLDEAKKKLDEMTKGGKVEKEAVKIDPMKQLMDSFSGSAVNFDSINTYISGVKDLLKNADLGSDLYNSLIEKLKDATTMSSLLQELMDRGLSGTDLQAQAQSLKEKLLSPDGIDQGALQKWLESLNEKIKEAGGVPLALNMETGEVSDQKNEDKQESQWKKFEDGTNKMVSGLSQVSSGLKGIGLEVPKEVDQLIGVVSSIMQVIQGVETVISVLQFGSTNANTVALAANTAALWAVVATNILPFAGGGIVPAFAQGGVIGHAAMGLKVPGNSYSGDNLRLPVVGGGQIAVNSGELILNKSSQDNLALDIMNAEALVKSISTESLLLNRAQQGVLADALSQGGSEGMELQTKVSAEEIIFVLNNNGKRRGIGNLIDG